MANGIGWEHKLSFKKINKPGVTNYPSNATSSTSNSHDKFNENIEVPIKEEISVDTNYGKNYSFKDAYAYLIQTQPVYNTHTKKWLIKMSLLTATPRFWNYQEYYHSYTVLSA